MQPQAREKAEKEGFEISIAKTSFKANTKALAENEGEGLAKVAHYHFSRIADVTLFIILYVTSYFFCCFHFPIVLRCFLPCRVVSYVITEILVKCS